MSRAKYRSERRQEQAEATRQAILDAARALFVERGYAGTTVADIAAAARVAVPTVYVSVGTKSEILGQLRQMIPVLADVPKDARAAFGMVGDPRQVISVFVAGVRHLLETSGELMFAIESAAPFEAVAAEAWGEGLAIHRATAGIVIERLEALDGLNPTVDATRAADILSAVTLPATWRTFGREHGWAYDEIQSWMIETVISQVMEREV